MSWPANVTWTCHVCGRERPDAAISVYTTDMSDEYKLPPGTIKQNVRYCNDRSECVADAPKVKFMGKAAT